MSTFSPPSRSCHSEASTSYAEEIVPDPCSPNCICGPSPFLPLAYDEFEDALTDLDETDDVCQVSPIPLASHPRVTKYSRLRSSSLAWTSSRSSPAVPAFVRSFLLTSGACLTVLLAAEFGVSRERRKNPLHGKRTWKVKVDGDGIFALVKSSVEALKKVDSKSVAAAILEFRLLHHLGQVDEARRVAEAHALVDESSPLLCYYLSSIHYYRNESVAALFWARRV